jgi:hypothetical protein
MGSEVVKIHVGRKRKEFIVHKKLICDASKFFKDAFTGPFKEGQEGVMYMPEDDPESFSCFIEWLYRNPLPIIEDGAKVSKVVTMTKKAAEDREFGPITEEEHLAEVSRGKKEAKDAEDEKMAQDARLSWQINRLLRLYYFAEKIFINGLMNRTMDRIRQGLATYGRALNHHEAKQIYLNTNQGSQLRVFCAEVTVYNLEKCSDRKFDQLATLMQEVPDLTKDILLECKSLVEFRNEYMCEMDGPECECELDPRERGSVGGGCYFHQHDASKNETCKDSEEQYRWRCVDCGVTRHGYGCSCF